MAASLRSETPTADARWRNPLPWHWRLNARTLVIELPARYRILGWAPMGGGLRRASVILNHQIAVDDRAVLVSPRTCLSRLARSLGFLPRRTVAMMTGANVGRGGFVTMRRRELAVSAWCSAGCSNALRSAIAQLHLPSSRGRSISQWLSAARLPLQFWRRRSSWRSRPVCSRFSRRP